MFHAWILIAIHAQACLSLYIANGSPCSSKCNATGGTFWPDLVCSDNDFANVPKGQTLQSCLDCTVDSTYVNSSYTDGNSDQFWLLYHMKYVQQYCLIDSTTPHIAGVNACTSACSPLSNVLTSLWISKHPFVGQYDYCSLDSSAYTNNAAGCSKCLQGQKGSVIIGNFVDTMLNACKSKPLASNGELVQTDRDLFNTAVIPISSPTRTSSITTSIATTTGSASTSSNGNGSSATATQVLDSSQNAPNHSGLSTGAAAGIGAAVAVLAIAVIAVVVFMIMKRRRRARTQENQSSTEEPNHRADPLPPHYPDITHAYPVHEKSAETQIYEAPHASARHASEHHLVELPGSKPQNDRF